MSSVVREIRSDLLYLVARRIVVWVVLAAASGAALAFTGSTSLMAGAVPTFRERLRFFEQDGITLADALAAPLTITRTGSGESIDNPLKYDYLRLTEVIGAFNGVVPGIGTVLDLVTIVIVPPLFLVLGAHLATYDLHAGTSKLRAVRSPWRHIVLGKIVAIVAMGLVVVAVCVVAGVLGAVVAAPQIATVVGDLGVPVAAPASVSPLALKLATTVGVGAFFGLIGFAGGAATRSFFVPSVVGVCALFAVPFLAPWDPRNLVAVVGEQVYDFWGQFELRPPLPLGPLPAALLFTAYVLAALAVAFLLPVRSHRFRG